MFSRRSTIAAIAAALVTTIPTPVALASAWVTPVPGLDVVVAYGAAYPGGTHRGVDLSADAGSEVGAPAGGQVTFAGRVPADGGGTCGAVTIELADGARVSLLPLDEVFVSAGDRVGAAEVVGTLAGAGDDSHHDPHLHVGLRRGEVYLDPTGLLAVSAQPTSADDAGASGAGGASTYAPDGGAPATGPVVTPEAPAASQARPPVAPPASIGSEQAATDPAATTIEVPQACASAGVSAESEPSDHAPRGRVVESGTPAALAPRHTEHGRTAVHPPIGTPAAATIEQDAVPGGASGGPSVRMRWPVPSWPLASVAATVALAALTAVACLRARRLGLPAVR